MADAFTLNEPAVLSIIERLEADLNGVIDTINASLNNDTSPAYPITYPQQILPAPPVIGQLTQFPIVSVSDGEITLVDDVGWGATEKMQLFVTAYLQNPDPVALAWQLRRYAQAITTVVMAGRHLDVGAWGTILKRVIPAPRIQRRDPKGATQIISWITLEILAMNEQDTG